MRKCIICLFMIALLLNLIACSPTLAKEVSYPKTIKQQIRASLVESVRNIDVSGPLKVVKVTKVPKHNYYTALFELKTKSMQYLGDASFIKKNGKFKQVGAFNFATDKVEQTTITVNNKLYNVIYGENKDKRIGSINAELLNKPFKYSIDVVDAPYFVHYQQLTSRFKMKDAYPTKLNCFNQYHQEMTWGECAR
ncbi:hypothetical protein WKH54_02950 [Priestia megaterium]|uniref:hypothetical protein n=1 Tax=Priestia megaterium TaxID=1404 RepID=UPI00317A1F9A